MKTIYMLWCIVVRGASVIRIDDRCRLYWVAYKRHNGRWGEGATPQEAVWQAYRGKENTNG